MTTAKKLAPQTVDAVRELIQTYQNCEWRETKFQILDSIAQFPHQRSFQFLFKISLEHKDLPLSEKAIQSLSLMNHPTVQRFLNHQYKTGPSYLKPAIIKALASIPDRTLAEEFVHDLKKAITNQQILLAKNLTLALGEFKYTPAVDLLFQIAADKKQRDLALSAVVSLGQILRTTERYDQLEADFKKDSFEFQIYTTSLHQIQFRSQWKLEDYLQKFYTSQKYHPALFFEISSFAEQDIMAGLELFASTENSEKTLKLLANLPALVSVKYYTELLKTSENADSVWQSLSQHHSPEFKKIIIAHKNIKNADWLKCLSTTLPHADEIFKDLFTSDEYAVLSEPDKIQIINSFSDYLFALSGDVKKITVCGKWIEFVMQQEKIENIIGRWLRLLSDINYDSSSVSNYVVKNLKNKYLSQSCLYFMKNNSHHSFLEALLTHAEELTQKFDFKNQFIKALAAQNKEKSDDAKISTILNQLCQAADITIQIDTLKFIEKYPLNDMKPFVIKNLTVKNEDLNLFAVVAIKKFNDEAINEQIAQHLKSQNLILRGRALDTLLSQPGARAKRLAIDHFQNHALELETCEKIIRCFVAPENSTDYFVNVVAGIIKANPEHPLLDNLVEFQNQLQQQMQSSNTAQKFSSTAEDIQKIEKDLEKKLVFYKFYDETAKSALRSAEVPFHHPEMYDRYIDKSAIILGYTKAIDIILEKQLGRKILFPLLEKRIFEFQNAVHTVGLNEDYASAEKVLKNLSLEKEFSAQSLPVHKMTLVSQGILNTKIINDHFKILDGLRAWAIILLMFSRKTALQPKPLVPLFSDDQITVAVAKKLMWLQDQRNPVAHRQTIIDFKTLEEIRSEVFQILIQLNPLFEKK